MVNDAGASGIDGYVVIFMSDGQPTDFGNDQVGDIQKLVGQLRQLAGPNRLTVSSVFFGDSDDQKSVDNLQAMATAGSGVFVNTNVTETVTIDSLITVPSCAP